MQKQLLVSWVYKCDQLESPAPEALEFLEVLRDEAESRDDESPGIEEDSSWLGRTRLIFHAFSNLSFSKKVRSKPKLN